MKDINRIFAFLISFIIFMIFTSGCEYKIPQAIWQADEKAAADPVILQINPQGSAFAGVSKIKIYGENFSSDSSDNVVYFNNKQGSIISSSPNGIVVKPPYLKELIKDSLTISVSVRNSYMPAKYFPYQLKEVSTLLGNFDGYTEQIFSIAVDNDENVYTMLKSREIYKVAFDGARDESWGTTTFPKASQIRFGPGGYLYLQKSNNQSIYRIPQGGGTSEEWVTLPNKVKHFDFDENKNLYAGGTLSDIFIVAENGTFKQSNFYQSYDINGIRVYDDYVYVLGIYKGSDVSIPNSGIWRSRILDYKGDIGNPELVLDWSLTGEYANSTFFDLTFASKEDGDMYIGTNYKDPVLVVHSDGTMEPLYSGLLNPDASQLVWGENEYLYINRSGTPDVRNLVRVDMAKKSAPYYGRN